MIERQVDSPMPRPSGFVVNKGSKMRCARAGSSPVPVPSTEMAGPPSSASDHDPVEQRLLQLYPVAHHGPIAGGELGEQRDTLPLQLAAGERSTSWMTTASFKTPLES
jgi:hypothetical protein